MQFHLARLLSSVRPRMHVLLICFMAILYALIFSAATVTRFFALKTYAYDLGNYNQALYTTLHGYGLLYYTADLPVTGGSMMGVHFSPILLIILPIYALYQSPPTLLVLKSFVLACGVFPLYWLAKHYLKKSSWGILFAAVYLLNPMLQGINWFDFHPEAFFPTFFLFSLYFGLKADWPKYLAFSTLTLTTTEYAALLVLIESVYLVWIRQKDAVDSLKSLRHLEFRRTSAYFKYPLFAVFLAVLWFFIALQVISVFSPSNPMIKGGAPQWSVLGASGTLGVPLQAILSPQRALEALAYDWPLKLLYVVILFGSTMFLSFLNPKSLIITLPWLAIALLSNYQAFYYIGNQYPVFLLPSVVVGSVLGMKKLLELSSKRKLRFDAQKVLALLLLTSSMTFSIISSPLYGLHVGDWPDLSYGIEPITEHDRTVMQISSLIPLNESVLTQNNIFPFVSSRTNSFVIPLGSFYPPGTDFNSTLNQWLQQSNFVLLDFQTSPLEAFIMYSYIKNFGVYASKDGVLLLRQNYVGPPVLYEKYNVILDSSQLVIMNGEVVQDTNSNSQKVLLHRGNLGIDDFWRSPYVYLPPGQYEITFKLKITNNVPQNVIDINVTGRQLLFYQSEQGTESSGHKISFRMKISSDRSAYIWIGLKGQDFSESDSYNEFHALFNLSFPSILELGSTAVSSNVDIYLDWVRVTQLHPLP